MTHNLIVSRQFVEALKRHRRPAYQVSWRAGVHPSALSKLIHGAERVRPADPRIIAVGLELGLAPDACFDTAAEDWYGEKALDDKK